MSFFIKRFVVSCLLLRRSTYGTSRQLVKFATFYLDVNRVLLFLVFFFFFHCRESVFDITYDTTFLFFFGGGRSLFLYKLPYPGTENLVNKWSDMGHASVTAVMFRFSTSVKASS